MLSSLQLTSLGDQLTDIYQASGGAVVLFDWVQFLREDALRFLNIDRRLELHSEELEAKTSLQTCNESDSPAVGRSDEQVPPNVRNQNGPESESQPPSNSAGLQEPFSGSFETQDVPEKQSQDLPLTASQKLMSQILIHDAVQQQKRFDASMFDCEVCFINYLGSDCLQLPACGHVFCRACISEYFSVQIKEGNVAAVQCPRADCTTVPTQAQVLTQNLIISCLFSVEIQFSLRQVKDLVQEELFNRYDRLLLQKTLDSMSGKLD